MGFQIDPSAAEISRRRRKCMVIRRISAENGIRPGDRRRRKKLRRLAEFIGDQPLDNYSPTRGLL